MNLLKSHARKSVLVGLLFFVFHISATAQNGEQLFKQNCASCHAIDKVLAGPALGGVLNRGPWAEDKKHLYEWIHNPPGFMAKDPYTQGLKAQFGSVMPGFPQLKESEIDAIIDHVMNPPTAGGGKTTSGAPAEDHSGQNALIFGIISLILAIVALILMQVNSNLKKLSDDHEGIQRPEAVPFYRNKIYIALLALVLFVVGGYYVAKGAINLGRQQGYAPTQPIYFSHKVHAGINQINCLYCHGGAWESKHAGIPTLNVCMNCHNVVNEYTGGPDKYEMKDEKGNVINGTAEIQKLYEYAGFTPGPGAKWDPAKAKSPEWVKIHNLPDHVYFNHAQHTRVGNVQCQTCHGNIQTMDKVSQQAELSMGWCINCHRETKVNFNTDSTGNRFYSLYEKFHNDIKAGKMDSVTVENIGGLECQKCHY
ncbi:MAG TPA: c-type cytochrome [Flavisolibacter sp.]|nr:c-type cytochrome [Flavisolibacter sp.]